MTSYLRRALPALIVCSLVVWSAPGRAQSQAPSMPGYPAVGAPPLVKLLAPGTGATTRLRYKVASGQKATMMANTTLTMGMSMGGQQMPTPDMPVMKMTSDVTTSSVAANGDIAYDIAVTGMIAESAPGADPTMAAIFSGAVDMIKNIKGSAVVNSRGVKVSSKLNLDSITDATVKQAVSQLAGSIDNVTVAFPEEAIGPGAQWEVRLGINSGGMFVFRRMVYELASVTGNVVTLKVTTEQTAPPQPMSNPALPAGMTMNIEKVTGAGGGTVTVNLANLVPTSDISETMEVAVSMDMGGAAQAMTMSMKTKTVVAPGK